MIIKIDRMHIVGYGKNCSNWCPDFLQWMMRALYKENGAKIPTLDKPDFLHGI
jgi:hypothetical protein